MIETILKFWFDPDNNQQTLYNLAKWWQKSDTTDQFIINQFSNVRMQAIQGTLDHWLETPKGTLAYIILIDQFSRNIFRDSSAMYEYDHLELQAATLAVDKGFDKLLSLTHRIFIYMPFEHSELILNQKKFLDLFSRIISDSPEEAKLMATNCLVMLKSITISLKNSIDSHIEILF